MRPRDLETLEFPRVLDAIAALARSPAGRDAVLALRPTADADEAANRLESLAEVVAHATVAGPPPTGDVPTLAAAVGGCGPRGRGARAPASGRGPRPARRRPDRSARWLRRDPESRPDARGDRRRHAPGGGDRGGARQHARPERTGARRRQPGPRRRARRRPRPSRPGSRRGCCAWSAIPTSRTRSPSST